MVKKHPSFHVFLFSLLFLSMSVMCFGELSDLFLQAKEQISTLIKSGDKTAAETAISKLKSDFADNPELPTRLFEISRTFAVNRDQARFRSMCADIVSGYPQSSAAVSSNIYLSRYAVEDLIDQGDTTGAQAGIAKMKVDFSDRPEEVSARLYEISHKFARRGDRTRFRSICQDIVDTYPESSVATPAKMYLSRLAIEDKIKIGDDASAEAAIEKMKTDFAGHPDLVNRLYEIGCTYGKWKDEKGLCWICRQIVNEFPTSSRVTEAQIILARYAVQDLIEQGDVAATEAAIQRMESDFTGHGFLPDRMYGIAYTMCPRAKEIAEFRPLCRQIVTKYCANKDKRIRMLAKLTSYDVLDSIKAGDVDTINMTISQIKGQLVDANEQAMGLCLIAEELSIHSAKKANTTEAKSAFRKAITLIDTGLPEMSDPYRMASTYYYLAIISQRLEDYDNAIEFYTKVVHDYPEYDKAWSAQSAIANIYYTLYQERLITQEQATLKIQHIYETIMKKWPNSPSLPMIRMYLQSL